MGRWAAFGLAVFPVLPLSAQVAVDLSLARSEFLLYEPIEVRVKVTNLLAQPLDLNRMSGKDPWLDFFITHQDEQIGHTDREWKASKMTLLPGQMRSVSVNLVPNFLIRDPGEYQALAQVLLDGKRIHSRSLKFTVLRGAAIWEQAYTAPPDPVDADGKVRPRLYSLLIHRTEKDQIIYARIQNPEKQRVYCTAPLGSIVNYGKPRARVDLHGNLHVLHQSGTRLFTYCTFSPSGKRLAVRFFSNLGSPPQLVNGDKDETQIVGGEEIFVDENQRETLIPTPRLAAPPEGKTQH